MSYAAGRPTYRSYTTNPILARLVAGLDGVPEALRADADAERLITAHAAPALSLDTEIAALVAAGKVEADKVHELATIKAHAVAREAEHGILLEIRRAASGVLENAATSGTDFLLGQLNEQLLDLTDEARPHIEDLGGAAAADDAIAAGTKAVAAWNALTALRTDYDALRTAQKVVYLTTLESQWHTAGRTGSPEALPEATDAFLANLDEIWPTWRATRPPTTSDALTDPRGTVSRDLVSGVRSDGPPWPQAPVPQLVWLIEHAELWVPTKRQLEELWTERRERDFERAQQLRKQHR